MRILLICILLLICIACGEGSYEVIPNPVKPGPVGLPDEIRIVVEKECQGCHAISPRISMLAPNSMKSSGCARVKNGSMPPGGIDADSKRVLLDWCG